MIISFEGIEGVGKSTQINLLKDWFEKRNLKTIILREPGSTKASEKIRDILLSNDISLANETELLLMFSARAQLINEKIVNRFVYTYSKMVKFKGAIIFVLTLLFFTEATFSRISIAILIFLVIACWISPVLKNKNYKRAMYASEGQEWE